MSTVMSIEGWTILSGLGYGQPTWVEVKRGDGAYLIVDSEDWAVMEDGLFAEDGSRVILPTAVHAAFVDILAPERW